MLERYGKSFKDILSLKTSFFEDNKKLLKKTLEYADLYTSQPGRKKCKICDTKLPSSVSFSKHNVPYVICTNCSHLNGMHEDTDEFCEEIYTNNGGQEYAENYSSTDAETYLLRRDRIYRPKAEFLTEVLEDQGEKPNSLKYADMGAGAGYFVSSMQEIGINNIQGFEVGSAQVNLGRWVNPELPIELIGLKDTLQVCEEYPADVMTFIGVFEHLQNPREILQAIKKNKNVKYIYFCVPMFGPCIFSEMVFPDVMPRQLAIGHTHLFTDDSIYHIEKEFGFERVGAWWFGTDMMDYYRSVMVSMQDDSNLEKMAEYWRDYFADVIDDAQLAIDKKRKSGQVHIALRVSR